MTLGSGVADSTISKRIRIQLKVQVNTSFFFLLHKIILCKLVREDVFHWDQMLKNQELNLKINELYVLQLVVLGIEYS